MKTLFASLLLAFATLMPALAQRSIAAAEIIEHINRNQAVSYENATITGDLDLTSLANRREMREGNRWGDSREFLSTVEVPLTFRNCRFTGQVLAYRTEERALTRMAETVFNADFSEAMTFDNCTFEQDAAFKYSNFRQRADFAGNTFRDTALFKYAKFQASSDFSGAAFGKYADFKYTRFGEATTFANARFDHAADFKYTKFEEGVTFRAARFNGSADFKYVHFPSRTDLDNTTFNGPTDFKYTTLNGRRFSVR